MLKMIIPALKINITFSQLISFYPDAYFNLFNSNFSKIISSQLFIYHEDSDPKKLLLSEAVLKTLY